MFSFIWSDDRDLGRIKSIPWNDLEEGIRLSLKNAARLASDGDLLRGKGSMASALVLYAVAWEEMGKAVLLLKNWKNHQDVSGRSWKKIFRSHGPKQTACFDNRDLLWEGSRQGLAERGLEQMKRSLRWAREVLGLYVEWVGEKKKWYCPSNESAGLDVRYMSYQVHEFLDAVSRRVTTILTDEKRHQRNHVQ